MCLRSMGTRPDISTAPHQIWWVSGIRSKQYLLFWDTLYFVFVFNGKLKYPHQIWWVSGIRSKQLKSNGNKLLRCNLDLSDWDESSEQLPQSLSSSSSLLSPLLGYGESHPDNFTIVMGRLLRDPGISRDPGIFSKSRSRDSQKSNPGIFWDFQKPLNDCIPRLSTTWIDHNRFFWDL